VKVVVVEFAGKGGMIHYTFQLCRAMAAAGAEVTLITATDFELASLPHTFRVEPIIALWDPKPAKLAASPIAAAFRKLRRFPRAIRYYGEWLRVIRRVAAIGPAVVQVGDVRFPSDFFPLWLLRRKTRLFADICHNIRPFGTGGGFTSSRWKRLLYQRIYRLFDVVFVHFERNVAEFTAAFGVGGERLVAIKHGNEEIFEELRAPACDGPALRARIGIGDNDPVVLFFGTLSRYKGVDILLEAFPRIYRETGARLVLAGYRFHDFDLAEHQRLAERAGIAGAVTWVPDYIASEEVAGWMQLASVIVFPYRDIFQSGAIHIAQTFGVPTVATAVGAMRDVVENEVSGLLVPPEDVDALANAVNRLLTDRELAVRLGGRFAADARGPFSWRANAETILAKYRTGPTFAR
jgi:glycosyltransferase involved in cell wall biosynthesis